MNKTEKIKNEYQTKILTAFSGTNIKIFFDNDPPTSSVLEKMEKYDIPYVIISLSVQ